MLLYLIISLFILVYLGILTHELGHLLYGIFHGFKFKMICVGPLGLKESDGKIKFYFEPNINYWGGISLAVPNEEKETNINVYTNMLIAGPIASFFFFFISGIIGLIMRNFLFLMFALICLGIFISTIIPLQTDMFYTDGSRYRILRKNDLRAREEYAVIELTFNLTMNKCYKYISMRNVEILQNSENKKNKYLGMLYAFNYFKEIGDEENKNKYFLKLEEARKDVPKKYAEMLES